MNPRNVALLALCFLPVAQSLFAAEQPYPVNVTPLKDRVRVEIGGQFFTDYIFGDGASKPYCYPILATDGTPMTRDFPMKNTGLEDIDHPWHRSLWFAHSIVNGVDFWNEGRGDVGRSPVAKGHTVQDKVMETTSGMVGSIRTRDQWIAPDGKVICTDDRAILFHGTATARVIDYEVTLHAPTNEPVVMGDNKDGTMAIRLAQWMTMPHKSQGGGASVTGAATNVSSVNNASAGHIVSSTGKLDGDVWGKRADWCDYYSTNQGKVYGVAIFDSTNNLRHPTWWQARDYGLFGANPFGQHDYENLKDQPHIGDYTIPAGGSLTLRYRFYFHSGDTQTAKIAKHYADYVAGK